jgi:hypothetical protein
VSIIPDGFVVVSGCKILVVSLQNTRYEGASKIIMDENSFIVSSGILFSQPGAVKILTKRT